LLIGLSGLHGWWTEASFNPQEGLGANGELSGLMFSQLAVIASIKAT
jgi:hypothetical protein